MKVEKILHQHQFEAMETIRSMTGSKGRIVIPTGGGKTLVESLTLRERLNNKRGGKIHLVLAPRIVLLNQIMKNYRDEIGQDYIALAFHSGRHEPDYTKITWKELSTTSTNVVADEFDRAKRMKKDLVVFSTYCSAFKLIDYNFETVICDESQYCVAEGFFDTVRDMSSKVKLFFTATEKHTWHDTGRGLNNTDVYGDLLYQVSPLTLAERGIIVLPKLHVMFADSKDKIKTVVDEVKNIAIAQSKLTNETGIPVNKILFAMEGTADVETVAKKWDTIVADMPGYRVFTITSKGGARINGKSYNRTEWAKELRETDLALILHYDILAEGIDIDGITGVAILRNMNKSKLLQTIGRAVRTYKANPSLKKNCWVSVTSINGDEECQRFVTDIILQLREGGFDIGREMMTFTGEDGPGIKDEDGIDDAYGNKNATLAQFFLDNVMHQAEKTELYNRINSTSNDVLEMEYF